MSNITPQGTTSGSRPRGQHATLLPMQHICHCDQLQFQKLDDKVLTAEVDTYADHCSPSRWDCSCRLSSAARTSIGVQEQCSHCCTGKNAEKCRTALEGVFVTFSASQSTIQSVIVNLCALVIKFCTRRLDTELEPV